MQREVLVKQELLPQSGTQILLTWAMAMLSQSSVCAVCNSGNLGRGHQHAKVGLAMVKDSPKPQFSPLVFVTHPGNPSCSFRFNICSVR